jgi:hypothetical protein
MSTVSVFLIDKYCRTLHIEMIPTLPTENDQLYRILIRPLHITTCVLQFVFSYIKYYVHDINCSNLTMRKQTAKAKPTRTPLGSISELQQHSTHRLLRMSKMLLRHSSLSHPSIVLHSTVKRLISACPCRFPQKHLMTRRSQKDVL